MEWAEEKEKWNRGRYRVQCESIGQLEIGNWKSEMNEVRIDCSSAIPPNSSTTTCPPR